MIMNKMYDEKLSSLAREYKGMKLPDSEIEVKARITQFGISTIQLLQQMPAYVFRDSIQEFNEASIALKKPHEKHVLVYSNGTVVEKSKSNIEKYHIDGWTVFRRNETFSAVAEDSLEKCVLRAATYVQDGFKVGLYNKERYCVDFVADNVVYEFDLDRVSGERLMLQAEIEIKGYFAHERIAPKNLAAHAVKTMKAINSYMKEGGVLLMPCVDEKG